MGEILHNRSPRSRERKARLADKRRAYFADRIMRGKLTSKMKRRTARAALMAAKAKEAEQRALQAQAEVEELDRIAAPEAAQEEVAGSVPQNGGLDAAPAL